MTLSFTSSIDVLRRFIFSSVDNCKDLFEFIDVSVEIDLQLIDTSIFSDIVSNVFERIEILVFKENRRINVFERESFEFRA